MAEETDTTKEEIESLETDALEFQKGKMNDVAMKRLHNRICSKS